MTFQLTAAWELEAGQAVSCIDKCVQLDPAFHYTAGRPVQPLSGASWHLLNIHFQESWR